MQSKKGNGFWAGVLAGVSGVLAALILIVGHSGFFGSSYAASGSVTYTGPYSVAGLPPYESGAAGGVTELDTGPVVHKIAWVSNASGAVDQVIGWPLNGYITKFCSIGDATSPPLANYDIRIEDFLGYDVLATRGTDTTDSVAIQIPRDTQPHVLGWHSLVIANAGPNPGITSVTAGTLYIWIDPAH